jgi:hypothetical protein
MDLAFLNHLGATCTVRRRVYVDDVLKAEYSDSVTSQGIGVYRYSVAVSGWDEDEIRLTVMVGGVASSEEITVEVNQQCTPNDFYVSWLNNLGHFEYWNFTARKTYLIDVLESKTQDKNIYNNWPSSYGEFADSITKQTIRRSKNNINVSSQLMSRDNLDVVKSIVSSPLVQIMVSQYDRRTIIVDPGTLKEYQDQDKTFSMKMRIVYTDELPVQSL